MQYNDFMTAITDIYGDYKSEILEQISVRDSKNLNSIR